MAAYLSNKEGNLFDEEEEIDDESFLRNSQATNYVLTDRIKQNGNAMMDFEERRNQLLQEQKEIEQRTVKSTERSLRYLKDSEGVGVATAEELIRQREQLENSESRLDEINSTLRISQKHIQSTKSIFGGLKNFFSRTRSIHTPTSSNQEPSSGKKLMKTDPLPHIDGKMDDSMSHPGMRLRYSEDSKPKASTASQQEKIDENLGHMLNHTSELKGMAYELSSEIDSQNGLIDNIHDKAERAGRTISKQNKDIRKLT